MAGEAPIAAASALRFAAASAAGFIGRTGTDTACAGLEAGEVRKATTGAEPTGGKLFFIARDADGPGAAAAAI